MSTLKKLLVVDVAALGWDFLQSRSAAPLEGTTWYPLESCFPAVTCTAQAAFRTAEEPSEHGMVGNGLFFRDLAKPMFWEQSASLVKGERIWSGYRERGGRVGMMFWQQSLGEDVDMVLSPKPIHKHSGGMVQDCFTEPHDLYAELSESMGRPFNLMHYWGPLASSKSSEWIVDATLAILARPDAPGLLLTYLPHLDYDLQRFGPEHAKADAAFRVLAGLLERLHVAAGKAGYEVLVFGDYPIEQVRKGAVFLNRSLREAGYFKTREVKGRAYPDFFTSAAWAMVDHAVAHVYVKNADDVAGVRALLQDHDGVAEVWGETEQRREGLEHERTGDLLAIAEPGSWFAYPWWADRRVAPDFATHVDIHNKPGYDPCELFFGWPPPSVSQDTTKIHGTHGRPESQAAWATTLPFAGTPRTLLELARAVQGWLNDDE